MKMKRRSYNLFVAILAFQLRIFFKGIVSNAHAKSLIEFTRRFALVEVSRSFRNVLFGCSVSVALYQFGDVIIFAFERLKKGKYPRQGSNLRPFAPEANALIH